MSEEVEYLSKKNETFLRELKKNDFYETYRQTTDELLKLREAHAILINMISTKELVSKSTKPQSQQEKWLQTQRQMIA